MSARVSSCVEHQKLFECKVQGCAHSGPFEQRLFPFVLGWPVMLRLGTGIEGVVERGIIVHN